MSEIIDARGLSCPQPVILTKRAMDAAKGEDLITIVDQKIALENVSKLAKSQGYEFEVEEKQNEYHIHMHKTEDVITDTDSSREDTAILIKSNLFGDGDPELGNVLMKSFIYALSEMQGKVKHIIFMNAGVFLTTEGSPVLELLEAIEEQGVEILSCGTCIDFYKLKDKLKVGQLTNMYTAAELMLNASKSLTL